MGIVLLGQRVLREPSSECGVVEACAEIVDVEGGGGVPVLALVLLGLEGGRSPGRQGSAEGVVVVGLQDRPGIVHDRTDRAKVVPDEMASCRDTRGKVHVSSVEPQALGGTCAVADLLEDEVPAPVDGGRSAGNRPHLPKFGAVGGIVVVDRRSTGERDRLREVDLVPGDGGDPTSGVRRQSPVGIVGAGASRSVEVPAIRRRSGIRHRRQLVTGAGEGQVVHDPPGGSAGPAVALQGGDVAVAVIPGDLLRVVIVHRSSLFIGGVLDTMEAVIRLFHLVCVQNARLFSYAYICYKTFNQRKIIPRERKPRQIE